MTKREELEAWFPRLVASVRALARLAIAAAKKAGSAGKQMITKNQIQARLAGQANIVKRKQIAELRDRLRGPLTPQERDLTARELTRLEGQLVKSLNGASYLRRARPPTRG